MVRVHCGVEDDVVTRIVKGMLRGFSHVEIMDFSRLTALYRAYVVGM